MKHLFSFIAIALTMMLTTPHAAHAEPADKDIKHIQSEYGRLKELEKELQKAKSRAGK